MKDTAIRKIFGKQEKLQGGLGAVLPLLYGLTQLNWEAAWPGIQKALIGLGITTIAAIKAEAIQRGLTGLAERIAAFEPTASPMPGEPLTPVINMPYIPLSPSERGAHEATMEGPEGITYITDLVKTQTDIVFGITALMGSPPNDPQRRELCERLERAWQELENIEEKYGRHWLTRTLMRKSYNIMEEKGCWSLFRGKGFQE